MIKNTQELEIEREILNKKYVHACPICKGNGYTTYENEDGYTLSTTCKCVKKVTGLVSLLDWGLPKKYIRQDYPLQQFRTKTFYAAIKTYIDNFPEYFIEAKGLFIHGPTGYGKTSLAAVIAKEVIQKINVETHSPFKVGYATLDDFVKARFDDNNGYLMIAQKADLLIIDNIGSEFGLNENKFSPRLLENIIRKRDNNCTPTIYISLHDLNKISSLYGEVIADLIANNNDIIHMSEFKYRNMKTTDKTF